MTQRLGERAEGDRRIGLGVTRDDDLAPPLEQRVDADVVAGVTAVGHVDQLRALVGGAEHLANDVPRPERDLRGVDVLRGFGTHWPSRMLKSAVRNDWAKNV